MQSWDWNIPVLPDPVPRALPMRHELYVWPNGTTTPLRPREKPLELDLAALTSQRQSRRTFRKRLDDEALGDFLWLACRNRSSRPSPFGPDQESRSHPSAGGMHPIHVLLANETGPWLRYDPLRHSLVELTGSEAGAAAGREAASALVELGHGTLIGLLAESGKTAAKYEHQESLVWRDAGVVLGYMSLMAEALGLSFCPLGITGRPHLTVHLSKATSLEATGLAVVGRG